MWYQSRRQKAESEKKYRENLRVYAYREPHCGMRNAEGERQKAETINPRNIFVEVPKSTIHLAEEEFVEMTVARTIKYSNE